VTSSGPVPPPTLPRPVVRFLVHGAERSGPPLYVLRLLRAWAREDPGFTTEVVLARPGPLVGSFRALGPTTVARLDRRSPEQLAARGLRAAHLGPAADALVRRATEQRLGHHEAALTVVNGATAPTATLLRALPADAHAVMVAHELSTGWFGNIDEADRRLFLGRCSRFLAVSGAVRDYLGTLGVAADRITVVPPPVDLPERPPTNAPARSADAGGGSVVVGGGGVTDWRKAPEVWLQVAAAAVRSAPEVPFRFVWFGGDLPTSRAGWPVQHEIDHLGLSDRVTFLGPVDDPVPVLRSCDLFVSTAREDAAPLVCAEAAGAGIPVLTFDTGGAAELVRDGRCGVVVPYPRVDELAAEVVRLALDRDARTELGSQGANHVAQRRESGVVAGQVGAWLMQAIA
jgi:glycosyltransferase involved in cell wall biosynthesis